MNFRQAVEELVKLKPATAMVDGLTRIPVLTPSKSEVEAAVNEVKGHLDANRHTEALATTLALLRWHPEKAIQRLRKESAFRASKYAYRSNGILKVVRAMLKAGPSVSLPKESLQYLESVLALQTLAAQARQLRNSLLTRLKLRQTRAPKTLLVVVNEFFSQGVLADRHLSSDDVRHWMPEEIAEAFSSLLELLWTELRLKPTDWQRTDESFVGRFESIYATLLLDAARLNTLREAETLIDGLPYFARLEDGNVVVASIDPDFEMSVRLGFVQAEQQTVIRAVQLAQVHREQKWNVDTLEEFASACFDAGLSRFVYIEEEPVRRLVFGLPDVPPLLDRLTSDAPFLEEIAAMYGAGLDAFSPEAGATLEVAPGLSALDVCKVQRLFLFIDMLFHRKLMTVEDELERDTLRVRSTIPVTKRADTLKMFKLVLTEEKAEKMLDFLTLSPETKLVDLQYRPFVQAAEWFVYAPAVVGKSNLMRNIVTGNSLRTAMVTANDPMEAAVVAALTEADFQVKQNFTFNIDGKRETDIFAWRDGVLFVLECKNAFHPCNPHELRNSFDHIQKAEEQLDIRLNWLQSAPNQAKLFAALGWKVQPTTAIHTGIITANRAFSGYVMGQHPVRQAHEFINVVLRGTVNRFDGQPPLRFWKGEAFQASDLIDYLRGASILKTQQVAMTSTTRRVRLGPQELVFETFVMDAERAAEVLEKDFGSLGPS